MRIGIYSSIIIVITCFLNVKANSSGLDLHWLWENSCEECHGHAGEFSRKYLTVEKGKLLGNHHVDNLRLFLTNHYLLESEVDAIYEMLLAQASKKARFKNECSMCHGTISDFIRGSFAFKHNQLFSLKHDVTIGEYLQNHRQLSKNDINFFETVFIRVAIEIYRTKN